MEVGTSYNERRLLWEAVRVVCAVTAMRRIPPGGPARCYAPPYGGGGFLWEVGTSYNKRRLLWKAVRPIMSKRSYGK